MSKSVTDYLHDGCPANKLVLGLPYYGYEWATTNLNVPGTTTASGNAKTFKQVRNNASNNYTTSNLTYDSDSYTNIYLFNDGGPQQCFISEFEGFDKRLSHVLNTGIAGIGIWALGYDDGYNGCWNSIENYLTDCYEDSCNGSIHDYGGPSRNYYNNENYHGRFRLQMPQISMLISPFLMLKQIMTICIFMMEPTPMPHKFQEAHLQTP